jgi:hypothetical protein
LVSASPAKARKSSSTTKTTTCVVSKQDTLVTACAEQHQRQQRQQQHSLPLPPLPSTATILDLPTNLALFAPPFQMAVPASRSQAIIKAAKVVKAQHRHNDVQTRCSHKA